MKAIAIFATVLAAANAQIIYNAGAGFPYHHGLTYAAAPGIVAAPAVAAVPVATKSQYHAQDELGQASWGHSEPTQAHAAVRDATGGVSGSFSYVDPHGLTRTTHYRADQNGYRVVSNNLPVAPAAFIAGPADTPEVHAAKVAHAAAHAEALARSGRKKRGVVSSYTIPSAVTYSAVHSPVVAHAPALTYSAVHAPVVKTVAAAPVAYTSAVHAPVAYTSAVHAPVAYSSAVHAPVAYSAVHAPVVAHSAVRAATLTKIVNTPGHAVSYRVD